MFLVSNRRARNDDGRVVERGHPQGEGIALAREGAAAASGPRIDFAASAASGLVPSAETQLVLVDAIWSGVVGLEKQPGLIIGGQQQGTATADTAHRAPAAAAIAAVVPAAMGGSGSCDGHAALGVEVSVAAAIEQA